MDWMRKWVDDQIERFEKEHMQKETMSSRTYERMFQEVSFIRYSAYGSIYDYFRKFDDGTPYQRKADDFFIKLEGVTKHFLNNVLKRHAFSNPEEQQ